MQRYRDAIAAVESRGSGDYTARGPLVESGRYAGERALGRYQIMPGNLPQWSQAALGREVTPDEFMANPALQDQIFDHRFGLLNDQYGNPQDAASAWFTGRPLSQGGRRSDGYIDGNEYVSRFNAALGGGMRNGPTRERAAAGLPLARTSAQNPPAGLLAPVEDDRPQWADTANAAALAFNTLRRRPDAQLAASIRQGDARRAKTEQTAEVRNRTAEWLASQGREDLARAVQSGAISGRDAFGVMMQRPEQVKGVEINGRLVNPVTGEVMGDYSDAPASYQQVRGADLGLTGENAERLFNVAPDGKITQVGGSGTTVTTHIGAGESEFDKATGKKLAEEAATVVEQGSQAQRNLGQINTLASALENSPGGLRGALSNFAANVGIKVGDSASDLELANSIIAQLVPQQRPPGSGVMSDADLQLFKQSLPRLINTPEGNRKIIATMRAIAEYDIQRGQIARSLQLGEITPQQAFDAYERLGNPVAKFAQETTNEQPQRLRFNPQTGELE